MILLDTCAILDMVAGNRLGKSAQEELAVALADRNASVSAVSAWEIGKLASLNRIALPMPPYTLFVSFVEKLGIYEAPLTSATMIASSFLPGSYHRDPWDRILIATARETGARILTSDRALLAYSTEGHVRTVAY